VFSISLSEKEKWIEKESFHANKAVAIKKRM